MTASTLIILNPHAGSGRAAIWREIEPMLWRHMGEMIVTVTQHPDEVARHVEQAYAVGVRRVIALGGDGTNYALVNALASFNQKYAGELPMILRQYPGWHGARLGARARDALHRCQQHRPLDHPRHAHADRCWQSQF